MNSAFTILAISLLTTAWSGAQNAEPTPEEDPIQAAIDQFESNRRKSKPPTEVSVVLPPPDEKTTPLAPEAKPEPATEAPPKAPVLVIGKAPQDSQDKVTEDTQPTEDTKVIEDAEPAPPDDTAPKPRKGLEVRVEKIQVGTEALDPTLVKLLAPFPAKPLAQPPAGWHLETSKNAPPFTRDVELTPGKHITLTVRPHILVPDTDGAGVFNISEPGFDPSLGYNQNTTVGAVLAQSIRQLDDDSKELGTVIDHLQQLLVSLPKPEPELAPVTKPTSKPTLKR